MASKRSRRLRHLQEETAARRKAEQQQALKTVAQEARSSIAGIVIQRMTNQGLISSPHVLAGNGLTAPAIKVQPDSPHTLPISTALDPPTTIPAAPVFSTPWPEDWPRCPESVVRPTEWRMSLENKDYYELKAVEHEINHPDHPLPWFAFPKYSYQYSEFVYLTVPMVQALMSRNYKNRPKDLKHIAGCARDIKAERWFQTHESIAINTELNLEDGQHRGDAILLADKAWPFYITWNVPPEAIAVIDSGKKRSVNQKLSFVIDNRLGSRTAALCRAMMMGLSARNQTWTEMEIAEFAHKHLDAINWVGENYVKRKHSSKRADIHAVLAKGYLWWGEEVVGPFCERYTSVNWSGEGDPVKALYLWATTTSKNDGTVNAVTSYKKALTALTAHAEGRPLTKLVVYTREEDLFEWLPGWKVPDNAPKRRRSQTPEVKHE